MGCFSCFDSRGDEKPISQKVGADRPEVHPTSAPSNISRLPSGVDRLKTRSNVSLRRESSGPKDNNNPYSQIAAHTFTLRELAAATNNFSPDCFLGEGGFGPVYRGRLPGTGQVVLDGYSAPLTTGNFAKLVVDGMYDGMKLKCTDQAILSDSGIDKSIGYSVPLEIMPSGQFEPLYKTALSIQLLWLAMMSLRNTRLQISSSSIFMIKAILA